MSRLIATATMLHQTVWFSGNGATYSYPEVVNLGDAKIIWHGVPVEYLVLTLLAVQVMLVASSFRTGGK